MLEIHICIGSSCHLKGSRDIIQILERLIGIHGVDDKVILKGSFCMGHCVDGVAIKIDDNIFSVLPSSTEEFFKSQILGSLNSEEKQNDDDDQKGNLS